MSCWEIGMLVAKGRLDLDRDVDLWVKQALALPKVSLVHFHGVAGQDHRAGGLPRG